jgi:HPt (histidine-containing phosphotransfer) domain-containing protein
VLEDLRSLGVSGGVSALDQVVEAFLESAPGSFREVRQAARDGDGEALRKVCHALKSNSAIVGAVRLSSLLKEAELAARSGEIDRVRQLVDPILSEYANVEAALSTVVQGVSHVG